MRKVLDGKRYDTQTSVLLAHDDEYKGASVNLYRTQKGNYFVWRLEGSHDEVIPVDSMGAKELYEKLGVQHSEYEDTFGVSPEEA